MCDAERERDDAIKDRDAWKKRAEQAERFNATNAAVIRSMSAREKQAECDLAEAVGLLREAIGRGSNFQVELWANDVRLMLARLDKRAAQGGTPAPPQGARGDTGGSM